MRLRKVASIALCLLMLLITGAMPARADGNVSIYQPEKHWAYKELLEFRQRIDAIVGTQSQYGSVNEDDKAMIRTYILDEKCLDQPIKVRHWATLLDAILKLPLESKQQLLDMYVFGLATGDEIARENAVGGMVKLLTLKYLSGQGTGEELAPAKALKDLSAVSERQDVLVRIAYCQGLLDSTVTEYFRPRERLLTAEAISMLHHVVTKYQITYTSADEGEKKAPAQPTPTPSAAWVEAEMQRYRQTLWRKAATLKTAETILLTGTGTYCELLNLPVTVDQWGEVLKATLDIADDDLVRTYTSGLAQGPTVPRDVAVAGLLKLLHYKGLVRARDASKQERNAAMAAFRDCGGASDTSKLAVAYSEGLVRGYPDHTFRPNQALTRGEALILMLNVIQKCL